MSKLYNWYLKSYKLSPENSAEFFEIFGDLIDSQEVQSLKEYEQHLEIDRFQHVMSVALISNYICKKLSKNHYAATRAAIMHDLVYYDWREGDTGKWHRPHGYKHPIYAAMNAKELCHDLTDKEESIIRTHMWPLTVSPPKSFESYVIVFADKYCATREVLYSVLPSYKKKFLDDLERF